MAEKREFDGSEIGISKRTKIAGNTAQINRCIDTIRILSADMVEKAKSGHPGAPMGCAPIAHILFTEYMKYNPSNPMWHDRDRFVLSNGHACALLYSMLHLTGYDVTMDDLKQFRQLHSKTPGHPENFLTPGVEVSTGPLGQGISNAVGLAMAEKHLAALFNQNGYDIVNHYTYVLCGDGCLQEGVSSEASSLAGHLGLGKLIVCYDDNKITIDGDTSLSFTEDVLKRYESYGWHVQTVDDVSNLNSLRLALDAARADLSKPSLIKIRTVIGFGCPRAGSEGVHGAPLGPADLAATKINFGFNGNEMFVVPEEVRAYYSDCKEKSLKSEYSWNDLFTLYSNHYPDLAKEYERRMMGVLPTNWKANLPTYSHNETKVVATRNRSEEVLNAIAQSIPEIFGGSADLTGSNLTSLKSSGDFQRDTPEGRYVRFGVREHAMAAICNGLFAHSGFRPFAATFLNFIGYALGAVRVSALSHFGIIYIMTHDSIGLGEDGPTHQPIEMLESLRAMPNLLTFRPADGNEVVGSYVLAVENSTTPCVISLSRQAAPTLEGTNPDKVRLGGYILNTYGVAESPDIILVSTGTELQIAVAVAKSLSSIDGKSVRVVSMPCVELFDRQPSTYQLQVFPDGCPVMSIEASSTCGWRKYAHAPFGVDSFGMSAPGGALYSYFGFTETNLVEKAKEVIKFYHDIGGAQSLLIYPKFSFKGH